MQSLLASAVLLFLILSESTQALEVVALEPAKIEKKSQCSDLAKRKDLPECPPGSLIPENYPVGALVISDKAFKANLVQKSFAADMVTRVLQATKSSDESPAIIFVGSEESYQKIVKSIESLKVLPSTKQKMLQKITHVERSEGYTWMQDFFQSFVDPNTGQVTLREVPGYSSRSRVRGQLEGLTQDIASALSNCGVQSGPNLISGVEDSPLTTMDAQSGGNIETLPGGICLLGSGNFADDAEWKKYGDQFCNEDVNKRVKVPTSWLKVGHTDEVIKIVPDKNKKTPCDFAVALSDPAGALASLEKTPDSVFFEGLGGKDPTFGSMQMADLQYVSNPALEEICRLHRPDLDPRRVPENPEPNLKQNNKDKGVTQFLFTIFNRAEASVGVESWAKPCVDETNKKILTTLTRDTGFRLYNLRINQEMINLRTEVLAKMKSALPACDPEVLELPNLYFGGEVSKKNAGTELVGKADAIHPSSVNSVIIGGTVFVPDPYNPTFRKTIRDEYAKVGLKVEFVDTYAYAHLGNGNLHCSTQTIHLCKPRAKK